MELPPIEVKLMSVLCFTLICNENVLLVLLGKLFVFYNVMQQSITGTPLFNG